MGEKTTEFQTRRNVKECHDAFRSGIQNGRGLSAQIGGIMAKVMGGVSLNFYTPQTDRAVAALDDDPPALAAGVAVPKAQGAHKNGTNVHMYVWDRGTHRDVALWAHHSLTGGSHATQLLEAVRSVVER